jgi:glutathione S-transferase
MRLYVCAFEKAGAPVHPCAKAAKALDEAGHGYELLKVKGGSLKPWTWPSRARDRAEVEQLSGQRNVPILVLDSREVVTGSQEIADWARSHPPSGFQSKAPL